jgi:hypothetical protein
MISLAARTAHRRFQKELFWGRGGLGRGRHRLALRAPNAVDALLCDSRLT